MLRCSPFLPSLEVSHSFAVKRPVASLAANYLKTNIKTSSRFAVYFAHFVKLNLSRKLQAIRFLQIEFKVAALAFLFADYEFIVSYFHRA
jgi:hypothetical protein